MPSRLVQVILFVATITLGAAVSFSQVLTPTVQAQASSPLDSAFSNDVSDHQTSITGGSDATLTAVTTLSSTDESTFSVFLPLVIVQPVPDTVMEVVRETNYRRSLYGCPPLMLNQQLLAAGQSHSDDMAINDFFSHTGSDGSSPWQRIQAAGYSYSLAAENIAAGYSTPQAVVQGWMNSPGHRDNILNCALQEIGVGYRNLEIDTGSVNYHYYWTQVFASPR